jgi:DNA-directed RNA polymerase
MTQTPIQRQLDLELEFKRIAVERLRERTKAAEERTYASSSVYGKAFISQSLDAVAERIRSNIHLLTQGNAQEYGDAVKHVKDVDPYKLALITIKAVLDGCLRMKHKVFTYTDLTTRIGSFVYDQIIVSKFEDEDRDGYDSIVKRQRKLHKGYSYKVQQFRKAMRKAEVSIPKWPAGTKHRLGAWLLNQVASVTGWVRVECRRVSKSKTTNLIRYSDSFYEARAGLLEAAETLAWMRWPMVCEPLPWRPPERGGYLTSEMREKMRLIRRSGPRPKGSVHLRAGEDSAALRMLNKLQRTAYRVNRLVYEVARECQEQGISIGKFSQERPIDPPLKPENWESASDEAKLNYRRERTRIEDYNHTLFQKNYRSEECLYVAERYLEEERFWIPWSFDYRGRVYPLVTTLSPQGTDFEKSLLLFSEEGPVNEKWLAFQVATTYGLDKASMDDRLEWVRNNHPLIELIANDPFANRHEWSEVSEPWCFLASCVEYNDCVIQKSRSTSGLPIGVDATCSGLQHLAALTLDGGAAQLVNVVPTSKPTDAYAVVANKAKEFLPESIHSLINRKVTKRVVMTVPYGVTLHSARDYVRHELPKDLPEDVSLSDVVKAIYREAIPAVIPGPIRAMEFIQKSAIEVIQKSDKSWIQWVTPSGFPVVQDLRESNSVKIKTQLLGSRLTSSINEWSDKPDISHHRGASAPNLIHSLDSTLLHLTFQSESNPFTLIHDCILMRSCDMDYINLRLREVFVDLYSKPVFRDWAEQIGVEFDESLLLNTLDINQSRNSPYLFC